MSARFNINSSERIGMTVCLILMALVIGGSVLYDLHKKDERQKTNDALRVEYIEFLKNDSINKERIKAGKEYKKRQKAAQKKKAKKPKPEKPRQKERDFLNDIID